MELARAGLFVYATGRSSRVGGPSEIGGPETIEETGDLIDALVRVPGFGISESPAYIGRGVAALATAADGDTDASRWAGTIRLGTRRRHRDRGFPVGAYAPWDTLPGGICG